MYTLGPGTILIKSIIIVCRLNLMAWKASWAHKTGENGEKDDKIKKVGPNVERLCPNTANEQSDMFSKVERSPSLIRVNAVILVFYTQPTTKAIQRWNRYLGSKSCLKD